MCITSSFSHAMEIQRKTSGCWNWQVTWQESVSNEKKEKEKQHENNER
jgi:hypothetical protein